MSFDTISVVGLGYIGLPTAAMFASRKVNVVGIDVNEHAVETINQGKIHIVEPDLDMLVHAAVTEGYLKAQTIPAPADAFLIAVPTPFITEKQQKLPTPDLTYIKSAVEAICSCIKSGDLIVLESTSPVGATEQVRDWLAELRPDLKMPFEGQEAGDIYIAHCPERVLPGQVVRELVENDRVIGGITSACSMKAKDLYQIFVKGECVITNARTAEMAKLTENSSRDVQIAFANELSLICDKLDINVWELIELANRHPRVNILQPGPGVGGHCIAVDPWFIVSKTPDEARLIHTARQVNDSKPEWVVEKVKLAIAEVLLDNTELRAQDVRIACYGLAFKPNIDDLRESPALTIAQGVTSFHSGVVYFVEPNITAYDCEMDNVKFVEWKETYCDAHIHVLLVDHKEFSSSTPKKGVIVDTKGIWTN